MGEYNNYVVFSITYMFLIMLLSIRILYCFNILYKLFQIKKKIKVTK